MPISASACKASGCTYPEGCVPALTACQELPRKRFTNASAIWLRQELPVHRIKTVFLVMDIIITKFQRRLHPPGVI